MPSRRDFLRLGAAAGAAAVAGFPALTSAKLMAQRGGKDYSPLTGDEREGIPTACWQCPTRCPAIGYLEEGRLVKIGGQPASIRTEGQLCGKGQAGVNQVYDPDRILHPLKRAGARGEGKWKRVTWEEALDEAAGRLKTLRDEGHPERLLFQHGLMKASSKKIVKDIFLAAYGTATVTGNTSYCESAKWTARELTWGGHYDSWDFDKANYILNFGSNCLEAHSNHVPLAQRLARALVERRVKMVTFDVRVSNTAAKSTEWVPIRPGTDGAVALAMCNVIMSEGLYRGQGEAFLEFCKVTPDPQASTDEKVAALIAHLEPYTPEWAAEMSGVSAEKIRSVAVEFATTKPACVISYRGATSHQNGHDTERAIQMLAAITGNVDNPGGRCIGVAPKWVYPRGPEDEPEPKRLEIVDGFPGQAAFPTHRIAQQVLKMIKDGSHGRPEVYMWYCHNPVLANGEVQENIDILKDESLIPYTVCATPFYDESAALADLILPDATYLERWDWEDNVSPNQIPEYYIRQAVVKPLGEARDFADVCCELAERMGFPLGFGSKEEFVQLSCDMTPGVKEAGGLVYMKGAGVWHDPDAKPAYFTYKREAGSEELSADGVIFDEATGVYWNWRKSKAKSEDEAREKGYAQTPGAYKGYVGQKIGDNVYAGFKPDKVNKSGYFELYSSLMEEKGLPALPGYQPIGEHAEMAEGELILVTYKIATQTNSRTQNCKWLTETYNENPACINPQTAVALGIAEGEVVRVKSSVGEISRPVMVTPTVVPGVIAVSHHLGHWEYGRYASGKKGPGSVDDDHGLKEKWWHSYGVSSNWIVPNAPEPVGGQQRLMDTVVTVTKLATV